MSENSASLDQPSNSECGLPFSELLKIAERANVKIDRKRPLQLISVVPTKTLAVSVTGKVCKQRCAHCNGHYLQNMLPIDILKHSHLENIGSLLISGGSLATGEVPLDDNLERLLQLPADLPLNLHIGLQDGKRLQALHDRRIIVSFDLIGDDETAREVYGLDRPAQDWKTAYENLQNQFEVIPHVTIGLRGGKISGEWAVIDYLATKPPPALTFLVFRPTPNTKYAHRPPPDPLEVANLIAYAASRLDCPLHLGCMRPAGTWRRQADWLAWLAGARTIVMPDHLLVKDLQEAKIPVVKYEECCSFQLNSIKHE